MPTVDDLPNGVPLQKISGWYDRFRFYRHSPSREELIAWIKQFSADHYPLAVKVLDHVIMVADRDIHQAYDNALQALPGWSISEGQRSGTWAFVGLGGQAESGPAMLHMFREANGLTSDRYQHLFVTLADLPKMRLTARDTVIFVDDFSGTGDQFSKHWQTYRELVSSEARTYLFLVAATSSAVKRLSELEDVIVIAEKILGPDANVFSDHNQNFNAEEQSALLIYCKRADKSKPHGWGKCELLLVISRKTPNNSLPILHAETRRWKGIFPRRLKLIGAPPGAVA